MPNVAAIFPGQGSHAVGMADALRDDPLLREGLDILGFDPFQHLDEGTAMQQPALFLAGAVSWAGADLQPIGAAGHSIGEYAALHAAGALAFADALRLVAVRGKAMAVAGRESPGGMVAVLGAEDEEVHAAAREHGLVVASDNAPGQLVLSGPLDAVEAIDALDLRTRRLDVSGAFHTELMRPAADALASALATVAVGEPAFPVLSNGTAAPFGDVRTELVENLLRPVRFRECVLALTALGADEFVELTAPGQPALLSAMIRRIGR